MNDPISALQKFLDSWANIYGEVPDAIVVSQTLHDKIIDTRETDKRFGIFETPTTQLGFVRRDKVVRFEVRS